MANSEHKGFPQITRAIENYISDEEGNITRNKIISVGALAIILGMVFNIDAFAGHRSHSSHRSHYSSR